uniref:MLO-like protein 1 isoform X2 n=1 Tax=Fragaria vesca subsp. vesca TaxID=101020 RepID=UPI0005CA23CA|nr:PREDICTED: MLO-like protein 1 isoform X2 [Fragaria vesca subsp. vesca]
MAAGGTTLEQTPTWAVAFVCSVIVFISLVVEKLLHCTGKYLKRKKQIPLFEALQKIKEELMLLGFISLLLTVFQDSIEKFCISKKLASHWLPCKEEEPKSKSTTGHFQTSSFFTSNHYSRHLLAAKNPKSCSEQMRQWKQWEDSIERKEYNPEEVLTEKDFTAVQDHDFIRGRFLGIGKNQAFMGWLIAFFKQFYGSVTKTDYMTMRLGFIKTHCKGNPNFNFHKYMVRALEADFKKVVRISWYLWIFVVLFLLLNVAGWHIYFWTSFVPFFLLLAVGTKLEHVIIQLAHDVADKHMAIEGDLVVRPSDDHFWLRRPRLVLLLIHIILFQNSFELAFCFWIWVQYNFDSCMMGKIGYVIPRLVIGVFVQFVCSYSTLPLYAIVTQMGTSFKKAIFDEHVQEGLVGWAKSARKHQADLRKAATDGGDGSSSGSSKVRHGSKYYRMHKEEATSVSNTTSGKLELAQVLPVHEGAIQPHQQPPTNDHA